MKTISEIMSTPPQSCEKNTTVQAVVNQMSKSNVGFLPVVDEDNKVIGTITDRDIALALGKSTKPVKELKVHEIMNPQVHSINPEEDASAALKIMRTKKVGRLPVVDKEKHLQGVVTFTRIARKINDGSERSELEHAGTENLVSTLYSLAERNANGK